jgi:hypothetical protein
MSTHIEGYAFAPRDKYNQQVKESAKAKEKFGDLEFESKAEACYKKTRFKGHLRNPADITERELWFLMNGSTPFGGTISLSSDGSFSGVIYND